MLPAKQMLNIQLAFWVNNPAQLSELNRGKFHAEKLANLDEWNKVVAVKQKIVDASGRPVKLVRMKIAAMGTRLLFRELVKVLR